jgi:hypothetical protein
MSTPHRDHGGTPETPSSNHYSMAMQRSGPTDAAEDEGLEYVREALQAGGHGLAYTEPHAATHFVADTAPRGSEVTHSSSLTDVARTDQSNLSRDVPMQGKLIDQSSSIRTMTFQEIAAIIMPKKRKTTRESSRNKPSTTAKCDTGSGRTKPARFSGRSCHSVSTHPCGNHPRSCASLPVGRGRFLGILVQRRTRSQAQQPT